jgi:hypothetical protein
MADDSTTSGKVIEWLKGGGLLAVTIIGVLSYFFLSVPTTVFYARFGVSPGEVGITYASLLSGSTVEIFAILLLIIIGFLAAAFIIAYISLMVRETAIIVPYVVRRSRRRRKAGKRTVWDLEDAEFEEQHKDAMNFFRRMPEFVLTTQMLMHSESHSETDPFSDIDRMLRRRRQLERLAVKTAEQAAELDELRALFRRSYSPFSAVKLIYTSTRLWLKRRGRMLAVLSTLVVLIILLPMLAYVQAGEVLDGHAYSGSNWGIFDYRAEKVEVIPTSPNGRSGVESLPSRRYFFLGQNSQYAVLYSSEYHKIVRVPIAAIIMVGIP